jgi:hypothetical protein
MKPPIHILFLIYGSIYAQMDNESKKNFSIYKNIMMMIDFSIKKILHSIISDKFANVFDDYFPSGNKSIRNLNAINQDVNQLIGGQPTEKGSSKLAYSITIDMELHPGTSLTPQQISESKCNTKYNAIRKAYAEFTGTPYVLPPVYPVTTKKNKEQLKGGRRKTRKNM